MSLAFWRGESGHLIRSSKMQSLVLLVPSHEFAFCSNLSSYHHRAMCVSSDIRFGNGLAADGI